MTLDEAIALTVKRAQQKSKHVTRVLNTASASLNAALTLSEKDITCSCGWTVTFDAGEHHARCFNTDCGEYHHR